MTDEFLDYVDENDNVIGQVLRSEIDKKGLIGRISGVVLFNSAGDVFLTKNASKKGCNAGKWHFTAIGHVQAGFSPEENVKKEAQEEVGALINDVNYLFKLKRIGEEYRGRRFIYIYESNYDSDFTLDKSEVEEIKLFSKDYLDNNIEDISFFTQDFIESWKLYRGL